MKIILSLLWISSLLWGSKILGYNAYDRYDHVDVVFEFDTPYKGKITQEYGKNALFLDIDDASLTTPVDLNLYYIYLTALHLYPKNHHLILKADVPEKVILTTATSPDGYTLRLRFAQQKEGEVTPLPHYPLHHFDTPSPTQDNTSSQTFLNILIILGLGFAMAFAVVIGVRRKTSTEEDSSPPITESFFSSPFTDIRFQKILDSTHTVVMIHTYDYEYLMLLGGGESLLLDTFIGGYPMTYEEFESLLRYHYSELKHFFIPAPTENTVVID